MELLTPVNALVTRQYTTPNLAHSHALWELVFFFDGLATTTINKTAFEVSSGDVFLVGPPHIHDIQILKTPHLHQDVYFAPSEIKDTFEHFPSKIGEEIYNGNRLLHLKLSGDNYSATKSYCENLLKFAAMDSSIEQFNTVKYQKFLAQSLLDFILGLYIIHYSKHHSDTPKWLLDFLNELQKPEVFSQRVSDIVALTNYSHSQVGTVFKNYKGMSLVDYLIDVRMNYARELLESTNESVLSISQECGYNSLSSFIKIFREKSGSSPLQYRKKRQNERGILLPEMFDNE